jgi:hypothetical protein
MKHSFWLFAFILVVAAASVLAAPPAPSVVAVPEGGDYGHGAVLYVDGHTAVPIYSFCAIKTRQGICPDGAAPVAGPLVLMGDGTLIGVTARGGSSRGNGSPAGVVYRLRPLGTGVGPGVWQQEVLLDFCTWWQDCDRYGRPVSITKIDEYTLDGVTMGTHRGVRWRLLLSPDGNGVFWERTQHWTGP